MGGCENYGPFLDPYSRILTTTHVRKGEFFSVSGRSELMIQCWQRLCQTCVPELEMRISLPTNDGFHKASWGSLKSTHRQRASISR